MVWVFVAAGAIALATVAGTGIGYVFKGMSPKSYNAVIGFSAGVMLCAAVFGLIEPSIEYGGRYGALIALAGIALGTAFLSFAGKFTPQLNAIIGAREENSRSGGVILMVLAIAIHHFPEGIAAGVSFGTGDVGDIVMVCGGIAIQNIPEAAVIIAPLLNSGVSKCRAFIIALTSGLVEVIGTFTGYFALSFAEAIMPFTLAFAGGSMIYIIIDEMIPQTHSDSSSLSAYSALGGFCFMLVLDGIAGALAL